MLQQSMDFSAATKELRRTLGPRAVRTDSESRRAASFDSSKLSFIPAAVVFPGSRSDVSRLLVRRTAGAFRSRSGAGERA
jgi:glycolate oxidase